MKESVGLELKQPCRIDAFPWGAGHGTLRDTRK